MSLLSRVRSWLSSDPGPTHRAGSPAGSLDRLADDPVPSPDRASASFFPISSGAGEGAGAPAAARAASRRRPCSGSRGSGSLDGPSVEEAIAVLRQVRGTALEATAVGWALRGVGTRAIPDPVRVAVRRHPRVARRRRRARCGCSRASPPRRGSSSRPISTPARGSSRGPSGAIERVLARDLDAPGARERHQRWSARARLRPPPRAPPRRGHGGRAADDHRPVPPPARGGARRRRRRLRGRGRAARPPRRLQGLPRPREGPRPPRARGAHGRGARRPRRAARARRRSRRRAGSPWSGSRAAPFATCCATGDLAALAPVGRWARPLARALARIHAEGLVHADVKPANVLLRQPHDPVLGDFGIARPIGAPDEGGGSAGYLSPERLAGRPSDPRDDVYGYGRVLEDVIHRLDEAGAAPPAATSPPSGPGARLPRRRRGPPVERRRAGAPPALSRDDYCPSHAVMHCANVGRLPLISAQVDLLMHSDWQ